MEQMVLIEPQATAVQQATDLPMLEEYCPELLELLRESVEHPLELQFSSIQLDHQDQVSLVAVQVTSLLALQTWPMEYFPLED